MLKAAQAIGFIPITDGGRAMQFYRDVLGLTFVADEPNGVVFNTGGCLLRLVKMETVEPAMFTVFGWSVDDIGSVLDQLTEQGIAIERYDWFDQDDRGVWTAPGGTQVAWFKDPDGNTLSVSQFAA